LLVECDVGGHDVGSFGFRPSGWRLADAAAVGKNHAVTMPSGTTAVPAKPAAPRLAFLDGWRAIAVALVVTSHVSGFRHDPLLLKQIARWLPVGEVGVLIFFFISGFVISRSALGEIARTDDFSIPAFYTRRFFRIIPPLALYLVTCLVLGALGLVRFQIGNALPAFLYVCNIGPVGNCEWLGGHTWSLAYEEQFYLLFPALLTLLLLRRAPFWPFLGGALIFAITPLFFPLSYAGPFDFPVTYGLFGAGFLAARHEEAIIPIVRRYAWPAFLAGAAVVLAAPVFLPWPAVATPYPLAYLVAIPVMVLASGATGLATVLTIPVLRYLGRISYGIYLWQELATSSLFRRQPLIIEVVAVLGVVVLCALLYEAMETPLIALGHRLSKRLAAPAPGEGVGVRPLEPARLD
jgi:peptidoglycan/LPS O-acetylase OafA/YrhL